MAKCDKFSTQENLEINENENLEINETSLDFRKFNMTIIIILKIIICGNETHQLFK